MIEVHLPDFLLLLRCKTCPATKPSDNLPIREILFYIFINLCPDLGTHLNLAARTCLLRYYCPVCINLPCVPGACEFPDQYCEGALRMILFCQPAGKGMYIILHINPKVPTECPDLPYILGRLPPTDRILPIPARYIAINILYHLALSRLSFSAIVSRNPHLFCQKNNGSGQNSPHKTAANSVFTHFSVIYRIILPCLPFFVPQT